MSDEKVEEVKDVKKEEVINTGAKLVAEFSIQELKIMVYDKSMVLQQLQKELEIINNEIISRTNAALKKQ